MAKHHKNKEQDENYPPILKSWEIRGLIIAFILLIFLPILLTQFSSFIAFDQNSGVIGDTLGGITAPIIGIVGAWVVYRSFQAQIQANQTLSEQHDIQMEEIRRDQSNVQLRSLVTMILNDFERRENQQNKGWVLTLLQELKNLRSQYRDRAAVNHTEQVGRINTNLNQPIERIIASLESFFAISNSISSHEQKYRLDKNSPYHLYILNRSRELLSVANFNLLNLIRLDEKEFSLLDPGHRESIEHIINRFYSLQEKIGPINPNYEMDHFFVF